LASKRAIELKHEALRARGVQGFSLRGSLGVYKKARTRIDTNQHETIAS
jgi:hypothetical protein